VTHGSVPGVPVGRVFDHWRDMFAAGSHRDIERGITGRRQDGGAESIVLKGPGRGYSDDVDHGDLVIYTGDGGRDRDTRRQAVDQAMTGRNQTLALNVDTGLPVRLHRELLDGRYRYDGLFRVEQAWISPGGSGHLVCRYRLRRLPGHAQGRAAEATADPDTPSVPEPGRRRPSTSYRLIRDTAVPLQVKQWHGFTCQICQIRLATAAGPYAEGAHIRPLGSGYDGHDVPSNVLCLCPNCHVRLDHGGLLVNDDLTVVTVDGQLLGRLRLHPAHDLDLDCIRFHRQLFTATPQMEEAEALTSR